MNKRLSKIIFEAKKKKSKSEEAKAGRLSSYIHHILVRFNTMFSFSDIINFA
jgi:hypothetical protein